MGLTWTLPLLNLNLIDLRDNSTLVISDTSTYAALPTVYSMAITPPGYPTINVTFTPGSVNVYKCVDLGLTCSDTGCTPLPDGIYDVIYTVLPPSGSNLSANVLEVKFIKIDQIKCKYQHAFLSTDINCHGPIWKQHMDELRYIKLYIDGSVAESNNSNYKLSFEYYEKANTMLKKMQCKFPKNNWTVGCGCK